MEGCFLIKVKITEVEDRIPICPYCEAELNNIEKIYLGLTYQQSIYICPYCRKILSVS